MPALPLDLALAVALAVALALRVGDVRAAGSQDRARVLQPHGLLRGELRLL